MCKRNSPDKNEANTGCARETPQIIFFKKRTWDIKEKLHAEKQSQHGMCKRNSLDKNEASMGCVREALHRQIMAAWDM